MKKQLRYAFILLMLVSLPVIAAACGPSAEEIATQTAEAWTPTPTNTLVPTDTPTPLPPTETPTPPPGSGGGSSEAAEILDNLNAAMKAVSSYHFEMIMNMAISMEGASFEVPFSLIGDYQAPDRMQAVMTMVFLGTTMEIEMITIGDTAYATDPSTGEWMSNANPANLTPFDPNEFVGSEDYDLQDPVLVGIEELDGVAVYHLSGSVSSDEFEEIMGEDAGEGVMTIDFWIGVDDLLLRKLVMSAEFTGSMMEGMEGDQEITFTIEMTMSDYNEPVSIEAPID